VTPARDHYSYTTYASSRTAQQFDDRRFGGPIGRLVADTQASVLTNFVGNVKGRRMLDVGTGTGRAARLFARGGAAVTAVDASAQMLAVARQRAASDGVAIRFLPGDAHALQFFDRSFDVAVCLRVLMHSPRWQVCLNELCRVSDRLVIFDYPSARSAAALQSVARRAIYTVGIRTEPYQVFTDATIAKALAEFGFRIRTVHRQFVLPIAFHKTFGSRRFTMWSEDWLDRAGLADIFGSPVTVLAERCASS
jgi:ubiquinone/menaquinone biosynthesis C-methylase UbiE